MDWNQEILKQLWSVSSTIILTIICESLWYLQYSSFHILSLFCIWYIFFSLSYSPHWLLGRIRCNPSTNQCPKHKFYFFSECEIYHPWVISLVWFIDFNIFTTSLDLWLEYPLLSFLSPLCSISIRGTKHPGVQPFYS